MKQSRVTTEIAWGRTLFRRPGAWRRMTGVTVFHDFEWNSQFPDARTQFRGCESLAKLVRSTTPQGKQSGVLLTMGDGVPQGLLPHERFHLVVVNIKRYLSSQHGDTATTYFAAIGGVDPLQPRPRAPSTVPLAAAADAVPVAALSEPVREWLRADPGRISAVVDALRSVEGGLAAVASGAGSALVAPLLKSLGSELWTEFVNAGADLPEALAAQRLWKGRVAAVAEFRARLRASDWAELDWQEFFRANEWIFGWGLKFQFLRTVAEQPSLGGTDLRGRGGARGDFLLASAAAIGFTVLVEIKRPDARLVAVTPYRSGVFSPSDEVVGGVVQLQRQRTQLARKADEAEWAEELAPLRVYTHEPRCILVVGSTATLADAAQRRSFEQFRRNLWCPEVLTFDELLARAEAIVSAASGGDEPTAPTPDVMSP